MTVGELVERLEKYDKNIDLFTLNKNGYVTETIDVDLYNDGTVGIIGEEINDD